MIRVAAAYPRQAGKRFDLEHYVNKHLPWVMEKFMPYGLRKVEVDKGLAAPGGGVSPFFAIGYLYFDSLQAFEEAFAAAGPEVIATIATYTDVTPMIQVGEMLAG
jgi:uncharacterized protein (TIGR02118 family)